MPVDIKFCGLTRAEDAAAAKSLGAAYVGVIFADGPRRIDPSQAPTVVAPARGHAKAVGVFGPADPDDIVAVARSAALDAVQLHGDPSAATIERVRDQFGGAVWAVVRIAGSEIPAGAHELFDAADAILLDAKVPGRLGGTGHSFDWAAVADDLDRLRARTTLVLAGGLNPENVAAAVRIVRPDVVDVSSGVESAPGIKDHARMHAFRDAVRGHTRGEPL